MKKLVITAVAVLALTLLPAAPAKAESLCVDELIPLVPLPLCIDVPTIDLPPIDVPPIDVPPVEVPPDPTVPTVPGPEDPLVPAVPDEVAEPTPAQQAETAIEELLFPFVVALVLLALGWAVAQGVNFLRTRKQNTLRAR